MKSDGLKRNRKRRGFSDGIRFSNPANGTVTRKKPGSLISKLWRWHTKWCPGWKAYQEELVKRGKESGG